MRLPWTSGGLPAIARKIKIKSRSTPVGLNILRKLEETLANERIPLEQKKQRVHPYYQKLFNLRPKDLDESHYSISWVRERYVQKEVERREKEVDAKVVVAAAAAALKQKKRQEIVERRQFRANSPGVIRWGEKKVYLPMAVVTLLMPRPRQSPFQAWFRVPLDWSKFDLRDYLYHGYGVKATNIGVYVKQMPVQDHFSAPRRWFRPRSKKFMVIEMETPFVWPKDPEDWRPWGVEKRSKVEEELSEEEKKKKEEEELGEEITKQKMYREHAAKLLKGSMKWEPSPNPLLKKGEYKIRT